MQYDYLIVGAGFFGSICAYELAKAGHTVCVIENRNHIGGNCYTRNENGIHIHQYGPHIFHTSNDHVWQWINQFTKFNEFKLRTVANYKGEIFSLPFNMWTFSKIYGITHPGELKEFLKKQSESIIKPKNLEEQAIKFVGKKVYDKLIKGYTEKQWMRPAETLPKEIIKRLPVRYTYDNNYFNDTYQGIPIDGYTAIFEQLLDGIKVLLNTDYFIDKLPKHKRVIYTGPIDKFFKYKYGSLEYKTTKFEHKFLKIDNYQGVAIMNYTDAETPYTRTIEHKFFQTRFPEEISNTWVTWEYPTEYIADKTEPYYPVNDKENTKKYLQYKKEADKLKNIHFGGRLAEYKYYDMHNVIERALTFCKEELKIN